MTQSLIETNRLTLIDSCPTIAALRTRPAPGLYQRVMLDGYYAPGKPADCHGPDYRRAWKLRDGDDDTLPVNSADTRRNHAGGCLYAKYDITEFALSASGCHGDDPAGSGESGGCRNNPAFNKKEGEDSKCQQQQQNQCLA